MKKYIGTKTIEAEPMNRYEFEMNIKGVDYKDENEEGYLVVYPDGYKSWSPKKVFEEAYDELLVGPNAEVDSLLPHSVFPSKHATIGFAKDPDYGGAHQYQFQNSLGFDSQTKQAKSDNSYQKIQFVQKNLDGSMTAGLQSEQLLLALIDRHNKLNAKFPSREGALAITKMQEALQWLEQRVKERMDRGVMGDLKK